MTARKNPRLFHLSGQPGQGVFCLQLFIPGQEVTDEAPPQLLDKPLPLLQPGHPGRADEAVPKGQISQTLDDIQKTYVLGTLKGAPGAAGAVPEGRGTQQG